MSEIGPWQAVFRVLGGLRRRAKFDNQRLSRIEDRLAAIDGGPNGAEGRRGIQQLALEQDEALRKMGLDND